MSVFATASFQYVCLPPLRLLTSPARSQMFLHRYELQLLMDWTFSSTTLLFEEWINVEQILAYVFRQRCALEYKRANNLSSGRLLNFWKIKIWSGVGLLLLVVLILWGPLVLSVLIQIFSPPISNPITSARVEVSMKITIASSSVMYSLFSIAARELTPIGCSSSTVALYASIFTACNRSSSFVQSKIQVRPPPLNYELPFGFNYTANRCRRLFSTVILKAFGQQHRKFAISFRMSSGRRMSKSALGVLFLVVGAAACHAFTSRFLRSSHTPHRFSSFPTSLLISHTASPLSQFAVDAR